MISPSTNQLYKQSPFAYVTAPGPGDMAPDSSLSVLQSLWCLKGIHSATQGTAYIMKYSYNIFLR